MITPKMVINWFQWRRRISQSESKHKDQINGTNYVSSMDKFACQLCCLDFADAEAMVGLAKFFQPISLSPSQARTLQIRSPFAQNESFSWKILSFWGIGVEVCTDGRFIRINNLE